MILTEKIIELVPDIVREHRKKKWYYENEHQDSYTWCWVKYTKARPITLADVLRAIRKSPNVYSYYVGVDGEWLAWRHMDKLPERMGSTWNLFTDLEGQSEETKAFIGKILGV